MTLSLLVVSGSISQTKQSETIMGLPTGMTLPSLRYDIGRYKIPSPSPIASIEFSLANVRVPVPIFSNFSDLALATGIHPEGENTER